MRLFHALSYKTDSKILKSLNPQIFVYRNVLKRGMS